MTPRRAVNAIEVVVFEHVHPFPAKQTTLRFLNHNIARLEHARTESVVG